MEILYSMLALTLIYSTPIIITAIGGMFSERSGVVNIALEGMMMIGGFTAATTIVFLEGTTSFAPWLSLLIGALAGGLISVIHAYLSIHLSSDQVISGTAINILAGGLTIYLSQIIFGQQRTQTFRQGFVKRTYSGLSEIPIVGKIFFTNMYPTVFLALALVLISWYVLYKTPFGLRLRATGEHPHAVDSMGISVYKMRYIGVILSGCLAGLGGGVMVLTQDTQFTIMSIHGTGFIALAALIFGKWKPLGLLGASLFFGFSQILSIYSTSIGFLSKLPMEYFKTLPYVLTIIALVVFSNKAVGPKAAGEPYDKGQR
ncbi:MAG: sugar ABC transporter permease [Firmicutes bacterium HGW-Firmicutes-3]|nr:MAG: sugar ABC transporter permease [Firmicutes bacterium HGW-Firmicutes-3]